MRDTDTNELLNFLSRMGMYIYPSNRQNVISFLTGYEMGSQNECKFTNVLSKKLEEKYRIKKHATGWPDQIERYAEKSKINWMQGFHLISSEALNEVINNQD